MPKRNPDHVGVQVVLTDLVSVDPHVTCFQTNGFGQLVNKAEIQPVLVEMFVNIAGAQKNLIFKLHAEMPGL